MKRTLALAVLLALLLAAMAAKGGLVPLPEVPGTAAAGEFDTARARARLARILGDERPHPVDSDANDAVRARLVAELRALGLAPSVTDDFVCNGSERSRGVACARVRNVLATIGGGAGPHVLMAAHYDSTQAGPGAADAGIGIASLLEVAALLRGRDLARPVTLLFNEGEETGLLGARAFVARHPLARRVDALVNLEARGVTGPALMFETSRPDAPAVEAYAEAVKQPAANSLMTDVYRLIPNSTDVAVFEEEKGWTILNLAIIGNETRYHSAGDNLAALDPRSLHHMGRQALALTETLARREGEAAGGSRLYADLWGRTLIVIPRWIGLASLGGLIVLFAWLARRRRGGVGRGTVTVAAALVDAALLVFVAQTVAGLLRSGEFWRAYPGVTTIAVYLSVLASCAAAILLLARPLARDRLRIAYWLFFLLLGAGLCVAAPGAAIFFLAPPLVAGAAMAAGRFERPAALLAWAILFATWAPLLDQAETLLNLDAAWMFAPVAALLVLPALIELKPLFLRVGRGPAVAALASLAVLAWAAALLAPAYSEDRKQDFGIEYAWDAEDRAGRWLVAHDGTPLPDAYQGFQPAQEVPWSSRERWAAKGPPLPLPAPRAEKLSERATPQGRLVRLRLHSGGAEAIHLRAEPEADLRSVAAGGSRRRFGEGDAEEDFVFRCHGRSCDGLVVDLLTGTHVPFEATLIGMRTGLPPAARALIEARPPTAQPHYSPDASYAVTRTRL